jgi:hypothetical protein
MTGTPIPSAAIIFLLAYAFVNSTPLIRLGMSMRPTGLLPIGCSWLAVYGYGIRTDEKKINFLVE